MRLLVKFLRVPQSGSELVKFITALGRDPCQSARIATENVTNIGLSPGLTPKTVVTEFLLQAFGNLHSLSVLIFIVFLVIFGLTITGNLLIIVLVTTCRVLHSPMYYFLCHLSVGDILLSVNIVPNILCASLMGGAKISYPGCIIQYYIYSGTTITECFLLSVMSYDRYVAICFPLHYTSIMDFNTRVHLMAWPWILGFTVNFIAIELITNFNFCNDHIIDHFYCDATPLQKISCSDTSLIELITLVFSTPIFIVPCCLIVISYVSIFLTILRIPSTAGKQKAFSTCSSHLIVVGMFYGTLSQSTDTIQGHSLLVNKIISLVHTVFTPMVNPLIYSFRNQDIRRLIKKYKG
ncbi:hypothetical protein GDO86_013950 [Hymenochirus boettgeri]|uniref:Olfactory receptor n=1 Tax=Hymenochirus boettgeri TaxID=247094 RepID=A0A8T2JR58_9PIPI|nr:hypothetical protein GDO86_013950 [Hymenochirus boettgeri]